MSGDATGSDGAIAIGRYVSGPLAPAADGDSAGGGQRTNLVFGSDDGEFRVDGSGQRPSRNLRSDTSGIPKGNGDPGKLRPFYDLIST